MPRPKFSLFSLLLFTLFVGSSVALFKNFDAWRATPIQMEWINNDHFSNNGDFYIAKSNKEIRIWDAHTGGLSKTIHAQDSEEFTFATILPDNNEILIGYKGETPKTVRMNWKTDSIVHVFENQQLFPNGPDLLLGTEHDISNDSHRYYFTTLSKPSQRIPLPFGRRLRTQMAPDHSFLLLYNEDQNVAVLNWPEGTLRFHIPANEPSVVRSAISSNERRAALFSTYGLRVFDTQNGNTLAMIVSEFSGPLLVSFLDDDRVLTVDSGSNSIHVWDTTCGQCIFSQKTRPWLDNAKLLKNGHLLATFSTPDSPHRPVPQCEIWNTSELALQSTKPHILDIVETDRGTFLKEEDYGIREINNKTPDARFRFPISMINKKGDAVVCGEYDTVNKTYDRTAYLLSRYRPEPWWGLAWLPEFWTTLVLASLFLWNLFRKPK